MDYAKKVAKILGLRWEDYKILPGNGVVGDISLGQLGQREVWDGGRTIGRRTIGRGQLVAAGQSVAKGKSVAVQ